MPRICEWATGEAWPTLFTFPVDTAVMHLFIPDSFVAMLESEWLPDSTLTFKRTGCNILHCKPFKINHLTNHPQKGMVNEDEEGSALYGKLRS